MFKMSPKCRAYIRALQREMSISMLFPGPKCRGKGQIADALHMNVYMSTCISGGNLK